MVVVVIEESAALTIGDGFSLPSKGSFGRKFSMRLLSCASLSCKSSYDSKVKNSQIHFLGDNSEPTTSITINDATNDANSDKNILLSLKPGELGDDEVDNTEKVSSREMLAAFRNAIKYKNVSSFEITEKGWKTVYESSEFSLFKRRIKRSNHTDGPVQYLMTGELPDISPFSFLVAQIHRSWRALWDTTMKDMSTGRIFISRNCSVECRSEASSVESEATHPSSKSINVGCNIPFERASDLLYYRTKWPWPLKDRDYTLARHCQILPDENAFVFVSRSAEAKHKHPTVDGAVRVDRYWCHSVVFSTHATPTGSLVLEPSKMPRNQPSPPSSAAMNDTAPIQPESSAILPPPPAPDSRWRLFADGQWRNMLALQRRHILDLKKLRLHGQVPFAAKQHFKWQLKSRMLQRRVEELCPGWMKCFHTPVVSRDVSIDVSTSDPARENKERNGTSSTLLSSTSLQPRINTLNKPGLFFVTTFCDDQKMPLHPKLVDILSSVGEKIVPESIKKLFDVARQMDTDPLFAEKMKISPADAGLLPPTEND